MELIKNGGVNPKEPEVRGLLNSLSEAVAEMETTIPGKSVEQDMSDIWLTFAALLLGLFVTHLRMPADQEEQPGLIIPGAGPFPNCV
jgi:hypothetical protein